MNSDKNIEVSFTRDTAYTARIDGATPTYYPTLLQAYNSPAATENVIEVWGIDLPESLVCGASTSVTIRGGYDQPYLNQSGVTTLQGLTIGKGTVTVEDLTIK